MRNICESFKLVMNMITKSDTFDYCEPFLKKTIKKFEVLGIIKKQASTRNFPYVYMLELLHPNAESVLYNYKLRTNNEYIKELHNLTKEDVAINAHIYRVNKYIYF